MTSKVEIERLRSARLLAGADEAWLERLSPSCSLRRYAHGEVVWSRGDAATSFHIVQRGLVRIVQRTPSGEDAMIGLFGPRESIGDAAVLERAPYPASAIAACDGTELLRVLGAPVLEAMRAQPALAQAMNRALLEHTRALRAKIEVLSAGAVPRRVASLLLHLAERFGDDAGDGVVLLPLPLSRAELAQLVGARVETVIRVMTRWQREGWLATTSAGFEIRGHERLARAAAGAA